MATVNNLCQSYHPFFDKILGFLKVPVEMVFPDVNLYKCITIECMYIGSQTPNGKT